jgi:hypothetical protein
MVRLRHFLCINRHIGLSDAFPRLERHMEIESLKEQLSGPDF